MAQQKQYPQIFKDLEEYEKLTLVQVVDTNQFRSIALMFDFKEDDLEYLARLVKNWDTVNKKGIFICFYLYFFLYLLFYLATKFM